MPQVIRAKFDKRDDESRLFASDHIGRLEEAVVEAERS